MKPLFFYFLLFTLYACSNKVTQADEEAVKKVVLDFVKDFNDGSFKNAENYATIDWVHINPGGGIKYNRETTLKEVRAVHQSFLKDIAMTTDSIKISFVKPDVALVTAYHTLDDFVTPDNVTHTNEVNIKSYVVVKHGGKWLLTLDQNTPVLR